MRGTTAAGSPGDASSTSAAVSISWIASEDSASSSSVIDHGTRRCRRANRCMRSSDPVVRWCTRSTSCWMLSGVRFSATTIGVVPAPDTKRVDSRDARSSRANGNRWQSSCTSTGSSSSPASWKLTPYRARWWSRSRSGVVIDVRSRATIDKRAVAHASRSPPRTRTISARAVLCAPRSRSAWMLGKSNGVRNEASVAARVSYTRRRRVTSVPVKPDVVAMNASRISSTIARTGMRSRVFSQVRGSVHRSGRRVFRSRAWFGWSAN